MTPCTASLSARKRSACIPGGGICKAGQCWPVTTSPAPAALIELRLRALQSAMHCCAAMDRVPAAIAAPVLSVLGREVYL